MASFDPDRPPPPPKGVPPAPRRRLDRKPFGDDDDPIGGAHLFFVAALYTVTVVAILGPVDGRGNFAFLFSVMAMIMAASALAPQNRAKAIVRKYVTLAAVVGSTCVVSAILSAGMPTDGSQLRMQITMWMHVAVGIGIPAVSLHLDRRERAAAARDAAEAGHEDLGDQP